ncbi:transposase [Sphingopyxis sp.]|jgi:putative transposase|uniref:transposase n=1 Tax=Sphingopyxis sp. TaxID=1908224 RepID=UPI002DE41B98|nr:transposase [Sphingopyxis sp.]
MARLARYVLPGIPHHVTQRGNGRQQTFFSDGDYAAYRDLLAFHCAAHGVAVWSWVLMPNHVHLILVPDHIDALRGALSKVHRAYAGRIHAREQRTGHFWQGRFGCVAMDEPHLLAALRYVALNPVRARLSGRAEDWPWSSTRALLDPERGDGLTDIAPVLQRVPDFAALLQIGEDADLSAALRRSETTGRPVGSSAFLERVEAILGRDPRPAKRGPKKRELSALSP